jgi:uncharacterized protein (TIGR03790 family)
VITSRTALWALAAALACGALPALRAEELAERVILLANRDDPDSLRIAQHYAEVRAVPAANIIALPMARGETISWREFVDTVWRPLQDELVRRKWLDAIPMKLADSVGRRKYAMSGHRISYLVVCRGVPLRIDHDEALAAPVLPYTHNAQFRTNGGAVDSELSLLTQTAYPINAFVPNALFRNERPNDIERAAVVKVARLDGPTFADANQLVDRAMAAERTGLLGRAYIDLSGKYPEGDRWLEATGKQIAELGFDTEVDRVPETIQAAGRFDAPVLYFGWYAGTVNGPFNLPGFQFPPGAIAQHIHSFSAATVRSATANWCGPLVARGVTATVGNVFEPYLQYLHRPDLLLRALARGDTFGDAAYFSLPVLSWQSVAIGDPLYRPFAVKFDEQWRQRDRLPATLAGYAVLRRMHQLDAADDEDEALALARAAQASAPTFAVGFELARRLQASGDTKAAAEALGFLPYLNHIRTDEWALARDAATLLERVGDSARAVAVYRNLFREPNLPRELRAPWLREARVSALNAGDYAQAAAWEREIGDLMMKVPAPGR